MSWWVAACLTSWILSWVARPLLLRAKIIDKPNSRSSHIVPTIRAGGVGIVGSWPILGIFAWSYMQDRWTFAAILLLTLILALVSFFDDIRPVPSMFRLAVHLALAIGALWVLGVFGIGMLGLALVVIWITGYTNAFNFMDGINGLASIQAILTGAGTASVALLVGAKWHEPAVWLGLVISGGAAGFLPHNFPKAKMFMGDVSSASLGFLLSILAVWTARNHGWILAIAFGTLHANFVLDTGLTLLRRIVRGENWREAHREHFYQRLIRAGWSHTRVTLVYGSLQVIAVVSTLLVVCQGKIAMTWIAAGIAAMWCIFFMFCERVLRVDERNGKN